MKITNRKPLIIVGAVLAVFIVTNPSPASFESYSKISEHRKINFLIASLYSCGQAEYIGVLGNFIPIDNNGCGIKLLPKN